MLCLLPFLLSKGRWRAWAILMAASVAGHELTQPGAFLAIDLIGALMLCRGSRWEMALALGFALMAAMDLAVLLEVRAEFYGPMTAVGWGQWGALLAWTVSDPEFRGHLRAMQGQRDEFDLMVRA